MAARCRRGGLLPPKTRAPSPSDEAPALAVGDRRPSPVDAQSRPPPSSRDQLLPGRPPCPQRPGHQTACPAAEDQDPARRDQPGRWRQEPSAITRSPARRTTWAPGGMCSRSWHHEDLLSALHQAAPQLGEQVGDDPGLGQRRHLQGPRAPRPERAAGGRQDLGVDACLSREDHRGRSRERGRAGRCSHGRGSRPAHGFHHLGQGGLLGRLGHPSSLPCGTPRASCPTCSGPRSAPRSSTATHTGGPMLDRAQAADPWASGPCRAGLLPGPVAACGIVPAIWGAASGHRAIARGIGSVCRSGAGVGSRHTRAFAVHIHVEASGPATVTSGSTCGVAGAIRGGR